MIRIKAKLIEYINNKRVRQFFGFVIAAFIFLMLTKLSRTYSKDVFLDVKISNLPQEQIIINDSIKIKAIVKSIGFNLLPLEFSTKTLELDSNEDLINFDNTYIWTSEKGKYKIEKLLGNAFEIVSIVPDSLTFAYEKMTVKKVPIVLNGSVTYAQGYSSLQEIIFSPDSLAIIGPKSKLGTISHIRTELLQLDNIRSDIDRQIKIDKTLLPDMVKLSNDVVTITNKIEKFTEGSLVVPIQIKNLPSDQSINYFPKTVSITYNVGLKDYKSIKASDFSIVCDFSNLERIEANSLIPRLEVKPDKVRNVRFKPSKIDFIITE